jgi:simple sugar transport system permease protein
MNRVPRWLVLAAVPVAVLALTALFLLAAGLDVATAGRAMVEGSLGSSYAIFSATLVRSVPLILTGLAVAWAFNAGVFNIGVEGQFLVGAAAATAVVLRGPSAGLLTTALAMVAGAAAGAGWAAIAAWLRVKYQVLEVISTIMLNFVAIQLVAYLVHGPLGDPNGIYPQSPSLPPSTWLPAIVPGTRLHAGFALAVIACAVAWYVRAHMSSGFRLRLVGANANAAWIAGGVSVSRVTVGAFLISGAIGGLAGAVEVSGVTYALYESISPGYGYTAIAIALLANLNPAGVIVAGIGFGAIEAGAASMQRDASVPASIVSIIEATLILLLAASRLHLFAGQRARVEGA